MIMIMIIIILRAQPRPIGTAKHNLGAWDGVDWIVIGSGSVPR